MKSGSIPVGLTDCNQRHDGVCAIASELAGRPVTPHRSACQLCSSAPRAGSSAPRAVNRYTVAIAIGALRHSDPAAAARLSTQYQATIDGQLGRLEQIKSGTGVGTELWRLLESLGIHHTSTCGCLTLAERMNALGPAGCRRERERLVAKMRENAAAYGWGTVATAAGRAVLSGLAWRINPLDPYGSLLDEAIRRAEAIPASGGRQPTTGAKLILKCNLCPGDILTLTAAVESLHQTYPGEYLTDVRTPAMEIWAANPHVTAIADSEPGVQAIDMHYPSISRCNQESIPFLGGYTEYLAEQLKRPLRLRTNRPHLYQSPEEHARPLAALWLGAPNFESLADGRPIWLVDAGVKNDYPIKGWPVEYYQEVIDRTCDRICWVQTGLRKHPHPDLRNVVSLLDTGPPMRETILLASRASGGLGPVTFFQHLLAAWQKPYICLVGGREPATWVQYPYQHALHTVGQLDCCRPHSCWKARVVPLGDGDAKDKSLCQYPVMDGLQRPAAKCMAMIEPAEVITLLHRLVPLVLEVQ